MAEGKGYSIEPGIAPVSSILRASSEGWAATEQCVHVQGKRIVYELSPAGKRPVAVLSIEREGDPSAIAEVLAGRRDDRSIKVRDIVGIPQIAERLEVDPSAPHQWRRRYDDFPAPLLELGQQAVYDWIEVLEWLDRRRPYGRVVQR